MIELNDKTKQDFLSREWMEKLIEAGIDVSDGKYVIGKDQLSRYDDEPDTTDYVWYKDSTEEIYDVCPTLTIQELLKLLKEDEESIESLADMLLRYSRYK